MTGIPESKFLKDTINRYAEIRGIDPNDPDVEMIDLREYLEERKRRKKVG